MIYLLLTIFLNVYIFVLFRLFPKYGIDNLKAIVVNYITCVITGSVFLGHSPFSVENLSQPWFRWSLLMGAMFIAIFNFIAFTVKKSGLTATTVANKLSLVIPVFFSAFLYQEHISAMKLIGIVLAFPAVYLTVKTDETSTKNNLALPFLLFIGSGLLDTLVKFVEYHFLHESNIMSVYLVHIFGVAAIIGLLVILFTSKSSFTKKDIFAGIILGVPNYFSIYFLVKLLNSHFLQSSAAIPVNNIGIVLLSTLAAVLFFKEKMNAMRAVGLLLSLLSILLIFFADING